MNAHLHNDYFKANGLSSTRGDRELFVDLSLAINPGELLHIQGQNGSGKTTLLHILCGLRQPDAGEVRWKGDLVRDSETDFFRDICYVGHKSAIKSGLSVYENLRLLNALYARVDDKALLAALGQVSLSGFENEPAYALSVGQQRRVGLARLLITKAKIWFLDEPYTALDAAGIEWFNSTLSQHFSNGGMVVIASHSPVNVSCAIKNISLTH